MKKQDLTDALFLSLLMSFFSLVVWATGAGIVQLLSGCSP